MSTDMSLGGYLQNAIDGRLKKIKKAYSELITNMTDLQKAEVNVKLEASKNRAFCGTI